MLAAAPTASARTTDAYDASAASALCEDFFGVSAGPEPLSACQWDMRYITPMAASRALATGDGVTVGVIDGGIDCTHPDLDNIDVGLSCSFINTDTPTADPSEIANGDCSNKAAVQDLQGHGTHVATTITGALDGAGIVGVAPDATIVGLGRPPDDRRPFLVMPWPIDDTGPPPRASVESASLATRSRLP